MKYVAVRIEWWDGDVLESAMESRERVNANATNALASAICGVIAGYIEEPAADDVPFELLCHLDYGDRYDHAYPRELARAWREWWNGDMNVDLWDYIAEKMQSFGREGSER